MQHVATMVEEDVGGNSWKAPGGIGRNGSKL